MPDWFSDNAPKSSASKEPDWFDLYDPKRKPVSAEDFAPPAPSKGWPARLADIAWGGIKAAGRGAYDTAQALSDVQRGAMTGDLDAIRRTGERAKGIVGAQIDQLNQMETAPSNIEAMGRGLAGLTPLIGPALADSTARAVAGDDEAIGETAVTALSPFAGRIAPVAGRAAGAVGRGVADTARTVASKAPSVALDVAEFVPGIGGPVRAVRKLGRLAEALDGVLKPAETAAVNLNAGGRLVKTKAPTLETELADALAEAPPEVARRTTLPPVRDLPPGYTPRTTVPKPKAAKPAPKQPDAAMGQPNYFLRKPAAAADEPVAASDVADLTQLPTSWRTRTDQPVVRVTAADIDEIAQGLTDMGMTPDEAIRRVSSDTQLAPETRTQLMTALGKVARKGAKR